MPWMLDLLSLVTGTEGQFISEATIKKTSLRVFSQHFDMPATHNMLPLNTVEGSWTQKKRQHTLSNTYLSTPLG